jgi:hypothetical protein
MKKTWILACILLFVTVAAFAQKPSQPPLSKEALAAILGQPAASSCATQPSGIRQAAKRPTILTGIAMASFDSGTISYVNSSPCAGLTGIQYQCCQCDQTGGCVPCCRCGGGNFADCLNNCG